MLAAKLEKSVTAGNITLRQAFKIAMDAAEFRAQVDEEYARKIGVLPEDSVEK